MTPMDRLDRLAFAALVSEAPPAAPPRVLERTMQAIGATRQRRIGSVLSFTRIVAVAAAVIVAGIVFVQVAGINEPPPATEPTATEPTATEPTATEPTATEPTATGQPAESTEPAASGGASSDWPHTSTFNVGGVAIEVDLPDGWQKTASGGEAAWANCCVDARSDSPQTSTRESGITFWVLDELLFSGCDGEQLGPMEVGPTVGDFADALQSLPGFEASRPEPASVDGAEGVRLRMTPIPHSGCGRGLSTMVIGPGYVAKVIQVQDLWILDVDGIRLIIEGWDYDGGRNSEQDALRERQILEIVDSIRLSRD